jgi:hypothetical protein
MSGLGHVVPQEDVYAEDDGSIIQKRSYDGQVTLGRVANILGGTDRVYPVLVRDFWLDGSVSLTYALELTEDQYRILIDGLERGRS